MRSALLLLVVVAACATDEAAEQDSAAAMAEAPPAVLQAADVSGTWHGSTMVQAGDSVLRRWTIVSVSDTTSILLPEGTNDTVSFALDFDADSMISTSEAYARPDMPDTPVTFRSVGRVEDGTLRGTVTIRLAANPDSVIERSRFEANRAP